MQGLPFVLIFVALTFLSWGAYGPVLHHGTRAMGNDSLRAFVGVGLAYFIIAVIVPFYILRRTGEKGHWSIIGTSYSIVAGAVGAIGALGVILALAYKGNPVYVMPIVFGFAPIVNTLVTAWMGNAFKQISGVFIVGILAAACGAGGVLAFKPAIRHATPHSASDASHGASARIPNSTESSLSTESPEPTPTPAKDHPAQPIEPPASTPPNNPEPATPKEKATHVPTPAQPTVDIPAKDASPTKDAASQDPIPESKIISDSSAKSKTATPDISTAKAPTPAQQDSSAAASPPPVVNPPQLPSTPQPTTAQPTTGQPQPTQPVENPTTTSNDDTKINSPPPVVNPPQLNQSHKVGWSIGGPKAVRYVSALATESSSANTATAGPSAESAEGNLVRIILSIVMAAFCWGAYGPMLHQGQSRMGGSRLRPFICVGLAYFLIAVAAPMYIISARAEVGQWTAPGLGWSFAAGVAGALGALGIILAFNSGGKPFYVMPIVFGFAPVVNTFITLTEAGLWSQVEPRFWISLAVVIAGAITVLTNAPKPKPHAAPGGKHGEKH